LIISLPFESLYHLLIWTTIGFVLYFAYGLHNSTLGEELEQEKIKSERKMNKEKFNKSENIKPRKLIQSLDKNKRKKN